MKHWLGVVALICFGSSLAHAGDPFAGKLDLTSLPAVMAAQSFSKPDTVAGVEKRVWHLDKGDQELLNVGLFAGLHRHGAQGTPTKGIGGGTLSVPGSLLDWALNTHMGDAWLPKLKTGVLAGWDFVRPADLKADPDFVGFKLTYPLGS